ncbi:MAG: Uncharacterised protein [Hyphomonas sp. TMED17]|nr:MAG: Uncharacterised protein [Hyphomonas sp. TMED17]
MLQFFIAAIIILSGHHFLTGLTQSDREKIYVSTDQVERLIALYTIEAGTQPTPEGLAAMITNHVREQALVKEARRLGLDQSDTVIERRLAQKMTFILEDSAAPAQPDDAELEAWFTAHPDKFRTADTVSFNHVFFAGSDPETINNIQRALGTDDTDAWRQTGDPFMLQRSYIKIPVREVARLFGTDFAGEIASLSTSPVWTGPVKSAFGQHLVRITGREASSLPPFEQVKSVVRNDFIDVKRREANATAINDVVARYQVEIEGLPE